jgi:tRNA U34 5-methylaminomethyl-2-thiouridine-forming methyltransferase MnmC
MIITTEDGFNSVISPIYGVSYHSVHGALEESNKVFIDMGLASREKNGKISIFEMGFGTGLNALLSYAYAQKYGSHLLYHTVEAHPLQADVYEQLNYAQMMGDETLQDVLRKMHSIPNDTGVTINDFFEFKKWHNELLSLDIPHKYDVIYYDAFAPATQPELWGEVAMSKMYDILLPGGCLVTYCAKGEFKRTLKKVGFTIESLPGPGRKREITRATK